MRYISIKNFAKHQHYKDRRPPWIKLHVEIMDDYEFSCLQDASKLHLILLWVLASKLDNRIPYDLAYLTKQLSATSPIDIEELVLQGFIELSQDDSKPLASRKQSAMPEAEAEAETEVPKKRLSAKAESGKVVPIKPAPNWVAEGLDIWKAKVGPIEPARFGKALKPLVAQYGWTDAKNALLAYVEIQDGKARKVEWLVADGVRWVALGKMPTTDSQGQLTERGRLIVQTAKSA